MQTLTKFQMHPDSAKFTFNTDSPGVLACTAYAVTHPDRFKDSLQWSITPIVGSNLTTIPSPPRGDTLIFRFEILPIYNSQFGSKYISTLLLSYVSIDSALIFIFYSRWGTNHQGGNPSFPNWYHYWSQALGVSDSQTYNPALAGPGQTLVYPNNTIVTEIGRAADWPPPGNPPTNHIYIDGFWATTLHEAWHREHFRHNLTVHGAVWPPYSADPDSDRVCSFDPNPGQPGQYIGGWELHYGRNPLIWEDIELIPELIIEPQGSYAKDSLDWAKEGSQWP